MTTRTLVVLRHGKSDWSGEEPDRERPLAKRGERQAPEAGAWIAEHLERVDLAVVSPATRTRMTWELVAGELDEEAEVRIDERVYAAWGRELRALVDELPDEAETVVIVGHNPGVEDLVHELTGAFVAMPTSAIAVLTWEGGWPDADGARILAAGRPPS